MTRFGDFSLLEDLGRSGVADRYKATHVTQGGPFFLKVYSRLDPSLHAELQQRCEALIGCQHPNLLRHLGHGVVDGLPFVVSPHLDGIDLIEMSKSLLDRRVNIGLECVILVLTDLSTAVGALHAATNAIAATAEMTRSERSTSGRINSSYMGHGDVSAGHVRMGGDGQIWLTGLTTPRSDGAGRPPEPCWDLAGVGALTYDLVPLLRGGSARPPLPTPLDRVVRRALGIGPATDRLQPDELVERLLEVGQALRLKPDRSAFAELVRRTVRAVEKRSAENAQAAPKNGHVETTPLPWKARTPADAIPVLDPVGRMPTLEPLVKPAHRAAGAPTRPAPVLELERVPSSATAVSSDELEATTELVPRTSARAATPKSPEVPRTGEARASPPPVADRRPEAAPTLSPWAHSTTRPLSGLPVAPPGPPAARRAASLDDTPPHAQHLPTLEVGTPSEQRTTVAGGTTDPDAPPLAKASRPSKQPMARRASHEPTMVDRQIDDTFAASPPAVVPRPMVPPPLPRTERSGKKLLLADPLDTTLTQESPRNSYQAAATEDARDATDPDLKAIRSKQMRRDPAMRALLSRGLVSEAALAAAVEQHAARGGRVVEILVASGVLTDTEVAEAVAAEAGRTRIVDDALRERLPSLSLVRRLPQTYVLARRVLPLSLTQGLLTVAVADPFDHATLDELKTLLGADEVEPLVASRAAVTSVTVEAYRSLGIGGVPGTQGTAATVLLCTTDDAKATRIGARLAQEGLRVEHVVNGNAAREILGTRPPDVVLCAHDLPGLSVAALLLFAREQLRTAETPFFVFGPRGDETLATRVLDLGADDYFTEPLKIEVMLAKLRRVLGKGRFNADGVPLTDPSGARRSLAPLAAPPMELDERPPNPADIRTADRSAAKRQDTGVREASFLENIAMPSLDDLPELPPGFDGEDAAPETPPAMPTGVMGTLRQMALPEIVQSLEMGRKTARVELVPAEGEKGMIAFEAGQIRYAECGGLRGDDAFYQLARHTEGFFRIHYGDKPPAINIEHPTTFLLLEAMRRMDEEGMDLGSS